MRSIVPFNRRNSLVNTGFDDFYNTLDDFFSPRGMTTGHAFRLDVQENEKDYLVEAELPGVKKEEIEIDIYDGRLTISVNREENVEDKDKNYVHKERRYSAMSRAIYLSDASPEGVKAKMDNGVLSVTVQKQDQTVSSRKIEIE